MDTKLCLRCDETKAYISFAKCRANPDGFQNYCNECAAIYPEMELRLLGTKTCSCCGEIKSRAEFYGRINRKGLDAKCKPCASAYICAWVKELPLQKKLKRNQNTRLWKANAASKDDMRLSARERGKSRTETLPDSYIVSLVSRQTKIPKTELQNNPDCKEMVDTRRLIITLKRKLRNLLYSTMNNLQLREILTNTLTDLVNDNISVDKANGIARVSDVILKSAIAESNFNRKGCTFFKVGGETKNPAQEAGSK